MHMAIALRLTGLALACVLLVAWAGCGNQDRPGPAGDTAGQAAAEEVTLATVDEVQFGQVLEANRGKVIFVDFWATWCVECVEMFPKTVELHKKYGDKGLVVMSVSMDDPESEADVLEFLKSQGATFPNYLSPHGAGPESLKAFGIDAGLPVLRIYDQEGELVGSYGSGLDKPDHAAIEEKIEGLLKP
jgi:thiol-disulfide isomerase/thioredoxin